MRCATAESKDGPLASPSHDDSHPSAAVLNRHLGLTWMIGPTWRSLLSSRADCRPTQSIPKPISPQTHHLNSVRLSTLRQKRLAGTGSWSSPTPESQYITYSKRREGVRSKCHSKAKHAHPRLPGPCLQSRLSCFPRLNGCPGAGIVCLGRGPGPIDMC